MEKKKWFWFSLCLFLIPEILCSFLVSTVLIFFKINRTSLVLRYLIKPEVLSANPSIFFLILGVELVGIISLLIWNLRYNNSKSKIWTTLVLSLFLVVLLIAFFIIYSVVNLSLL